MTHDKMIAVIQAHKSGANIELREWNDPSAIWEDNAAPTWNFWLFEYRVKSEPKFRPWKTVMEVPVGEVMTDKDTGGKYLVMGAMNEPNGGVSVCVCQGWVSAKNVLDYYQMCDSYRSPCGVQE